MSPATDTIAAIATPPGHASLGVIRISGPDARQVGRMLLGVRDLEPRRATLRRVVDPGHAESGLAGEAVDRVVATLFPRPGSYTGEDVLEIAGHGSPVILERILAAAIRAGARPARPGEFTLRAFQNGKLDLVQAEAVADLIDAATPSQARVALRQLDGRLTAAIREIEERFFDLRVRLEASLDFPEEGYHFIEPGAVATEIEACRDAITGLLRAARAGQAIREGHAVVVLGPPNAGKSSLFNHLIGEDRAIVTPLAGTTRDLLMERSEIGGVPLTLVDTAGLRETGDEIEREGVARAHRAIGAAAVAIVVLDGSRDLETQLRTLPATLPRRRVVVASKADLPARWTAANLPGDLGPLVPVSIVTPSGIEQLRRELVRSLTEEQILQDVPSVSNVRHIGLLERAAAALEDACIQARSQGPEEVILTGLQDASASLEEIVGARSSEDVLTAIFSRFCIGK